MSEHWRSFEHYDDGVSRWKCTCGEHGGWMATDDVVAASLAHSDSATCEFCHEPMSRHDDGATFIDGIFTCCMLDGREIRTVVDTSVPVAPGTDATPDGRGATSRRDRAGTIPAAEILTRFDTAYPWWAHYRDSLAALRDWQGKKPQPGRHAARESLFSVVSAEMQAAHDGLMGLGVRR